jgi:hypothetical protein
VGSGDVNLKNYSLRASEPQSKEAADEKKLRMKNRGDNGASFCNPQLLFIRSFPFLLFFIQAQYTRNSRMVPAIPG